MNSRGEGVLFGRHPVLELLRAESRRVDEVAIVAHGRSPALLDLLSLAKGRGVKVSFRTRDQLTAMAGTTDHQGVVARVAAAAYADVESFLVVASTRVEPAFLLALDRVQDPRNLGAVLRSAEATGAHGVIVAKHHAAGLTSGAAKSATGAAELVGVARVTNMINALEELKEKGIWIIGAATHGGTTPWAADLSVPLCFVLGGEGGGLRPLVAKTCDLLLTLPMKGKLDSLNVAAVAAILCYEAVRQRGGGLSRPTIEQANRERP
jgi:23S rRNA (guanosine2251-2'-O)-methyltransferase